jgi:hypothetical protein
VAALLGVRALHVVEPESAVCPDAGLRRLPQGRGVPGAGGMSVDERPWTDRVEERLSAPDTKRGKIQRLLLKLLIEHRDADDGLPTNGRFVFYELEQQGQARKSKPGESPRTVGWPPGRQDVTDDLMRLRERRCIPWWWIEDETRQVFWWSEEATLLDTLIDALVEARITPWNGQAPFIICEDAATAGVLRPIVARYRCPIAGTGGQAGGFLHTDVAPLLADNDRDVLYLGDLDKSGHDIETNTRRVLERAAERPIEWRRLGMTEALVEQTNAIRRARGERLIEPIWKVDGRTKRGHWAIEVEALGQTGVVELVRRALDDVLPEPLADVQERERVERDDLRELLEAWRRRHGNGSEPS